MKIVFAVQIKNINNVMEKLINNGNNMFNSVNKVIILGTISSEPSTRYAENGFFIATMSVMTVSIKQNKNEDKNEYKNEWHRVLLYNKFEKASKNYKKGKIIYLEGSLRTSKWLDKENNYKYTTEIIASDIKILDLNINEIEIDAEEESNKNNKSIFDENIPF